MPSGLLRCLRLRSCQLWSTACCGRPAVEPGVAASTSWGSVRAARVLPAPGRLYTSGALPGCAGSGLSPSCRIHSLHLQGAPAADGAAEQAQEGAGQRHGDWGAAGGGPSACLASSSGSRRGVSCLENSKRWGCYEAAVAMSALLWGHAAIPGRMHASDDTCLCPNAPILLLADRHACTAPVGTVGGLVAASRANCCSQNISSRITAHHAV